MEPMTLGSPSSPSAANSSSYLPSYLMGEPNIMTVPRTNTLSPTKGRTLAFCKYIDDSSFKFSGISVFDENYSIV